MSVSTPVDLTPEPNPLAPVSGAVNKAMIVLAALMASDGPLTLAELSRLTGLAKSTVHRLLVVLGTHHAVSRRNGTYGIGTWISNPVRTQKDQLDAVLRRESTPYLVELHNLTRGVASIHGLAGNRPHCVSQIYDHRSVRGGSAPAGCASAHPAVAKVLHSYGADLEEPAPGTPATSGLPAITSGGVLRSCGVGDGFVTMVTPLHGAGNRLQHPAVLAVTGRAERMDLTAARELRRIAYELIRLVRHHLVTCGSAGRGR